MILPGMLLLLCGCYNRYTGSFEQFPDIHNLPDGVVDQAGLTEEDKRRQLELLKAMDAQKEPVYRINAGDKISIRVYNHPDLIMESLVTPDGAIVLCGDISASEDEGVKILAKSIQPLIQNGNYSPRKTRSENHAEAKAKKQIIYVKVPDLECDLYKKAIALLSIYEAENGNYAVSIYSEKEKKYIAFSGKIIPSMLLISKLKGLLGDSSVVIR